MNISHIEQDIFCRSNGNTECSQCADDGKARCITALFRPWLTENAITDMSSACKNTVEDNYRNCEKIEDPDIDQNRTYKTEIYTFVLSARSVIIFT